MISLKRRLGKDISITIGIIFLLSLLIRTLFLDVKPAHFDEGVNGWFVEQMKLHRFYDYNPENFHGPLYFYILYIFDFLFGSNVFAHRFAAVVCSLAAIFVFDKSLKLLKAPSRSLPLLALALSPGLVFYSRYSIHESLLVLGFMVWLYGCIHWLQVQNRESYWWLAIGFFIMAATKETFLIFVINTGIAFLLIRIWNKKSLLLKPIDFNEVVQPLLFLLVSILCFYTKFFTSLSEIKEFFTAFAIWKDTGFKHTGHEKPFYYWLQLFGTYEWIFAIGLIFSLPFWLSKNNKTMQFLSVYAFGNLLAFSLISYKTPWCIMALLFPYAYFLETKNKVYKILVAATLVVMGINSLRLNFIDYANPKERYVYVQTSPKMNEVVNPLREWIQNHPQETNIPLLVVTQSEWPLPWLLKDFSSSAYTSKLPKDWEKYQIIIIDQSQYATHLQAYQDRYFIKDFQIRYEQEPSKLLIEKSREDLIALFQ